MLQNVTECNTCKTQTSRDSDSFVVKLQTSVLGPADRVEDVTFASLLRAALQQDTAHKNFCETCRDSRPGKQSKRVKKLPGALAIHAAMQTEQDRLFWKLKSGVERTPTEGGAAAAVAEPCRFGARCTRPNCRFSHAAATTTTTTSSTSPSTTTAGKAEAARAQAWIPVALALELTDGELSVAESMDEAAARQPGWCTPGSTPYDLVAAVFHIADAKTSGNLVAVIKPAKEYFEKRGITSPPSWFLFNDFSVAPVGVADAQTYDMAWKTPSVFYYVRRDVSTVFPLQYVPPHDHFRALLLGDKSLAVHSSPARRTFLPLSVEELPRAGDLVAIDTEFVSLAKEQADIRSDGVRATTLKPSQMACARITVLRGGGLRTGEPFIDDYIRTPEMVVDYLTEFSGIVAQDLDPHASTRHLTTMKNAYAKLRFLQDAGVVFVGHGLSKDFRVVNLDVDSAHVRDTVLIYNIPGRRKIKLKFLAAYVLGLNMQAQYGHDSIEDARTTLMLYKRYLDLSKDPAEWEEFLRKLYYDGQLRNWEM